MDNESRGIELPDIKALALAVDQVLEYDTPGRIAHLMEVAKPIIEREFGGTAGWGSQLAMRGYKRLEKENG